MGPEILDLLAYVHRRFRETFGEPARSNGNDEHWSILPRPGGFTIAVLLHDAARGARVLVFNPNEQPGLAFDTLIRTVEEADWTIESIGEQVHLASVAKR